MRIAFFVLSPDTPSTRFRVLQYLPALSARQVKFKIVAMEPSWTVPALKKPCRLWHYLRALFTAWRCDLVFLQKPGFIVNRWPYLRSLFGLQKNVIFDFDDAIFIDLETGLPQAESRLRKLEYILTRSRWVIAGNPYLAEFARKYNRQVEIIPTPVDGDRYRPRQDRPLDRSVIIGWMGTDSNLPYLFTLIPVLRELLAETDARLLVISNPEQKPAELEGDARIVWRTWQEETEPEDLARFDIGIMPLADDAYTRGKCGFKLLQYMAVGIPVVASPVGMNREIVEDGISGFLAVDEKDWLEKLGCLCRDRGLRERMGSAGRKRIEEKYSLRRFSVPWLTLLQTAAVDKKICR